jgi:hypothetical protein
MLKIKEESLGGLDFNFTLTERENAVLCAAVKQEWFDIVQRLMEQEIRLLNIKLINTSTGNPTEILANHAVAKGAAQFYAGFMQRLIELLQIEQYNAAGIGSPENPEKPPMLEDIA